jgi:hypothetical protein
VLSAWDGRPFDGMLVVYPEQGCGDLVPFARFLPATGRTPVRWTAPTLAQWRDD